MLPIKSKSSTTYTLPPGKAMGHCPSTALALTWNCPMFTGPLLAPYQLWCLSVALRCCKFPFLLHKWNHFYPIWTLACEKWVFLLKPGLLVSYQGPLVYQLQQGLSHSTQSWAASPFCFYLPFSCSFTMFSISNALPLEYSLQFWPTNSWSLVTQTSNLLSSSSSLIRYIWSRCFERKGHWYQ